ncbi:5-dehydro-4-deoxy-D-glucuronate isomerase [Arcicella lustrica]|uniref:4-deoxy-L-threo-5-hexosulose-uronate ketol-isomerase n=1 Tax=Arcicella lustrica TaxID=2984196 RepID=A0ABU5SMN2_9BACT|nr:5-dehydro-4-deoxy-D-glucuronate isomerase [Arcicella sp. DC25W]MEA5428569.1 5-dehydro-4-deoxy-D-glucuronate isomerase [Arcicella sp. DC25W]
MQSRYESSPKEVAGMNTESLRANFLIEKLFEANQVSLTYTHYDRVITGGVMPVGEAVSLPNYDALKSEYFLERRELGIINVGGDGKITADGEVFLINKLDCLYLGKGVQSVSFESIDANNPAQYFLISSPAHQAYPTRLMKKEEASPVNLGSNLTSNERTIYKYIHLDGIRSCQLVMGLTVLANGSVWNTMPAHTHDRRMEVYCYFDVPQNQAVLHLMGQPQETRHLFVSNHQAIISPPWSVHSGCGTANYSFIWAMAGENQLFTDMDFVEIPSLR